MNIKMILQTLTTSIEYQKSKQGPLMQYIAVVNKQVMNKHKPERIE